MKHITSLIGVLLGSSATAIWGATTVESTDTIRNEKTLNEVVVDGYGAERNLNSPEMGRLSLSENAISSLPVMFGEPDIVRSLQTQPGVAQGMEGFTGLYVRGGENDQNLFLYQGLPLYQVSHIGGIFSSFNVATLGKVDFYKAAFPAQYGGRTSSITDITARRPDFTHYNGQFTIGLLSANVFFGGPILKEKTAFTIGIRRSWADLFSVPVLAIINSSEKKKGKKHIAHYAFTDINLRLEQRIGRSMTASVTGYYGRDNLRLGLREFDGESQVKVFHPGSDSGSGDDNTSGDTHFYDENVNRLSWGNWGVAGDFDWDTGNGVLGASVYYSDYSSTYRQEEEYQNDLSKPDTYGFRRSKTHNSIQDVGGRISYSLGVRDIYRLMAGVGAIHHKYHPDGLYDESMDDGEHYVDDNGNPSIPANEGYFYIDNLLDLSRYISLSAGVRGVLHRIQRHTTSVLEPRASIRVTLTDNLSLKMSYGRMNQFVQQLSSNYINLPTDMWQPIPARFRPMRSDIYSAGIYGNMPLSMYFSLEGWYKDMKGILDYREGVSILNPGMTWEEKLTSGKGWAYGVDLSVTRTAGPVTGTVSYGLMWNWRKFDDLNGGVKFPAKFDNRHKINITAGYALNSKIEFNAAWTYMTGNRMTLSMYNYDIPGTLFPDGPTAGPPGYGNENDGIDYYDSRNNVRLPAYHRLDIGMNLNRQYKSGHRGVWNFSLYNAYCHLNAITIKKDNENDVAWTGKDTWHRAFKTLCLLPVIPSVSYTYIF